MRTNHVAYTGNVVRERRGLLGPCRESVAVSSSSSLRHLPTLSKMLLFIQQLIEHSVKELALFGGMFHSAWPGVWPLGWPWGVS